METENGNSDSGLVLFFDWSKPYSEFSKSAPVTSKLADYTIIMSRSLKVMGNHVMYASSA